jgi:hypothetical protein
MIRDTSSFLLADATLLQVAKMAATLQNGVLAFIGYFVGCPPSLAGRFQPWVEPGMAASKRLQRIAAIKQYWQRH